jgi:hypothetical protein
MAYVLYLHLVEGIFSWMRECVCTIELKNYASSSLVAGRTTHVGHILRGGLLDKERPSPSRLGVGLGADILTS